jgi:hypothetical protein
VKGNKRHDRATDAKARLVEAEILVDFSAQTLEFGRDATVHRRSRQEPGIAAVDDCRLAQSPYRGCFRRKKVTKLPAERRFRRISLLADDTKNFYRCCALRNAGLD